MSSSSLAVTLKKLCKAQAIGELAFLRGFALHSKCGSTGIRDNGCLADMNFLIFFFFKSLRDC